MADPNPCSFDGCGKLHYAKGLCQGHYNQLRKGHSLRPLRTPGPIGCRFAGCGNQARSRGLCSGHYMQLRIEGPEALRPLNQGTRAGRRRKRQLCSFDGCGRKVASVADGLCVGHRYQLRTLGELRPLRWRGRNGEPMAKLAADLAFRGRLAGCWVDWPYAYMTGTDLRPAIVHEGRTIPVVRLVLFLESGSWPVFACHHCDDSRCYNPAHVYAGDHASNTDDLRRRGRARNQLTGKWPKPERHRG